MQGFTTESESGHAKPCFAELSGGLGAAVPFTRACSLRPFVDILETMGAPAARFLQQSGIPAALLGEPEALVPLRLAYLFLEKAARAEGIDQLGLAVGQRASTFDLGVFGGQLRRSVTVYDYLRTGVRLIGSATSGERFWLTREGERLRVNHYLPGKDCIGRRQGDVYTLALTLHMLRRFTDQQWSPEEVCLLDGCEQMVGRADAFGNTRLVTGQAHSSFTIPLALLQKPIPPQVTAAPLQPDSGCRSQPSMPEDLVSSIELVVISLLPAGCPGIHLAAEAAGMSARTLQRRLGQVGLSYSQLLQRARERLAAQWLADSGMSVSEIAGALGYRDPANFTRAFRRKAGISPQQYRKQVNKPS